MPTILSNLPVLDDLASGTNGTNSTTNSTVPAIPGGIGGYTHTTNMVLAIGVLVGLLVIGSLVYFGCFRWYKKRAQRKIEEAGNVQISVSRGGNRK